LRASRATRASISLSSTMVRAPVSASGSASLPPSRRSRKRPSGAAGPPRRPCLSEGDRTAGRSERTAGAARNPASPKGQVADGQAGQPRDLCRGERTRASHA
jgi:hypothetical protein